MPWLFERQFRKWVRLWSRRNKTSGDAPGQLLAIPVNERVVTALGLMKIPPIEGDFLNLAIGVWECGAVFAIPALRR